MSKDRGAKCKLCRRAREKLFLKGDRCHTAKCAIDKRNYPPGDRSARAGKKISEYGRRLIEKQKLRRYYGVSEKCIRIYFRRASTQKGITGLNLLWLFEMRVDNIMHRLNFALSRPHSRQLVGHGHFLLNGVSIDVPSILLVPGDVITLKSSSKNKLRKRFAATKEKGLPDWLGLEEDGADYRFVVKRKPSRTDIDVPVEEQLVVEYYSR